MVPITLLSEITCILQVKQVRTDSQYYWGLQITGIGRNKITSMVNIMSCGGLFPKISIETALSISWILVFHIYLVYSGKIQLELDDQ